METKLVIKNYKILIREWKKIRIPTYTLVSGYARKEQAEAQLMWDGLDCSLLLMP